MYVNISESRRHCIDIIYPTTVLDILSVDNFSGTILSVDIFLLIHILSVNILYADLMSVHTEIYIGR